MQDLAFLKDMPLAIAAIAALLIVIRSLYKLLDKQIQANTATTEALTELNKTISDLKGFVKGILEAGRK